LLFENRSAADNEIVEAIDAFGEFVPSVDAPLSQRLPFLLHVVWRPLLLSLPPVCTAVVFSRRR
jgi:hypothetical protein